MADPIARDRYPSQIKYIIGNEACERFSFYGMGSILTVYMAHTLGFAVNDAEFKYHLFNSACYLMPLFGGWLSDRWLGRYRTILWLSFGYVAGHAVIALYEGAAGLYSGMALIALGAGGIKPCVSAFVGDQFTDDNKHLIDKVYSLFYVGINVGSIFGQFLIPWLLPHAGPRWAFGTPGLAMAAALLLYIIGSRQYRRAPPSGANPNSFLHVVAYAVRAPRGAEDKSWLDKGVAKFPGEAVEGAKAVFRILGVFSMVIVFWALFFQYGSSWVIQAEGMYRPSLPLFGPIEASQVSTLNALFVLIIVPILAYAVYPALHRRGVDISPLRKMTVGMFIACFSFVCAAAVQHYVDTGSQPHVGWQIGQYFFISLAEALVSVTGLEFAYTQAPKSMKSTIMGFWFLSISAGNMLTAVVAKANTFGGATFYLFFAGLMVVAAVAFAFIAARYKPIAFVANSDAPA